jgi:hypothetical protein
LEANSVRVHHGQSSEFCCFGCMKSAEATEMSGQQDKLVILGGVSRDAVQRDLQQRGAQNFDKTVSFLGTRIWFILKI